MLSRVVIHVAVLLALGVGAYPGKADEISFVGDLWPPFNGVHGSDEEGYFLDIARAVFESKGHRVTYVIRPWKRAVREVEAGAHDALLGPFVNEAPGFVFPEEEIGFTALSFFTRSDGVWTFTGLKSLAGVRLGIIQDYDYRPWLQQYRREHPESFIVVSGKDAIFRNLDLLIRGRVDVIPTNEHAFRYRAKVVGVLDQIRFAGRDTTEEGRKLHIAFSPSKPTSAIYAELLSEGIRELRQTGRLAKILDNYGLKDWK
jgi:polar amino acid transport system substrate-binding protein